MRFVEGWNLYLSSEYHPESNSIILYLNEIDQGRQESQETQETQESQEGQRPTEEKEKA